MIPEHQANSPAARAWEETARQRQGLAEQEALADSGVFIPVWLDPKTPSVEDLQAENARLRKALEMALPWMNGLVRDIGERGRWSKELADDCRATQAAVRAALEASDG